MYARYFGFSDAPFSIAPDPRFLYLSPHHREALAHLLYGVEQGGFVVLTGEVGTGKTTVCRCLLQQLPPQVDVAFIINPRQDVCELLQSVLSELGLTVDEDTRSVKVLVDLLNERLLEGHSQGRNTILIIDEAQNLAPEVLEQLRLLTNLETRERKLLQLILLGQPELNELLDSRQLRQLAQRVTARYHLHALAPAQVPEYVRHRLAVAGFQGPLFSSAALRRVARRSGGVPRLVNLICDRALLGIYANHERQVTPAVVERAAAEVLPPPANRWWRWGGVAVLLVAVAAGGWWWVTPPAENVAMTAAPKTASLGESDLPSALRDLAGAWGVEPASVECPGELAAGVWCQRYEGELDELLARGFPAVLELSEDGERGYALLRNLEEGSATLNPGPGALPREQLAALWSGQAWLITPLEPALEATLPLSEGDELPPALAPLSERLLEYHGLEHYPGYKAEMLYDNSDRRGMAGVLSGHLQALVRDGSAQTLTPTLLRLLRKYRQEEQLPAGQGLDRVVAARLLAPPGAPFLGGAMKAGRSAVAEGQSRVEGERG